jgi:hypothetical protein
MLISQLQTHRLILRAFPKSDLDTYAKMCEKAVFHSILIRSERFTAHIFGFKGFSPYYISTPQPNKSV